MKFLKGLGGAIVGAVIGAIVGLFFGVVFGSAVTKKSEYSTRAATQVIFFVPIGAVGGAWLGAVMATTEE